VRKRLLEPVSPLFERMWVFLFYASPSLMASPLGKQLSKLEGCRGCRGIEVGGVPMWKGCGGF